ncbi:MAG TPA: site-2 protease family protein [Gemmatimonadota bacterium]|nr:site-2 protease family protein [Gemmatimonadota bacterium]
MNIEPLVYLLPLLLFSIIVHEVAHGWMAERWGDPTARMLGRITLNPLPHIDPIGSILVPAILLASGSGVIFGWAKPVPVTPENFRDRKLGDIAVSLAGPGSNVLIALGLTAVLAVAGAALPEIPRALRLLCSYGILLNLILAVFNLIPVPPLDGSHVVAALLPPPLAYAYRSIGQVGMLVLLAVLFFIPGALGVVFLPARLATHALLALAAGP